MLSNTLIKCGECYWSHEQGPHLGCYIDHKWYKWVKGNKLHVCKEFKEKKLEEVDDDEI